MSNHSSTLPSSEPLSYSPQRRRIGRFNVAFAITLTLLDAGLHQALAQQPDQIPPSTQAQLQRAFVAMAPLHLDRVADADVQPALDHLALPASRRADLERRLAADSASSQSAHLAWIDIWDFAQEDGDVVRLTCAGIDIDVKLQNAHTRLAIPVDASQTLNLTGLKDGGGGITAALAAGDRSISLPVLMPGQTLKVALSF